MTLEDIRSLYDYNSWANHRIRECCAGLTDEQFTRNLGSSFPSVRDSTMHICAAEWLWLERWKGSSPSALPVASEGMNFRAVNEHWTKVELDLMPFVAGLQESDLSRVVHHKTTQGVPQSAPLWQMMQHVVNHGTYHRGQVTTMLRQLGAKAQAMDLILFYRQRAAQGPA
jgi:uncharacterized damage-inducible protein DinB